MNINEDSFKSLTGVMRWLWWCHVSLTPSNKVFIHFLLNLQLHAHWYACVICRTPLRYHPSMQNCIHFQILFVFPGWTVCKILKRCYSYTDNTVTTFLEITILYTYHCTFYITMTTRGPVRMLIYISGLSCWWLLWWSWCGLTVHQ